MVSYRPLTAMTLGSLSGPTHFVVQQYLSPKVKHHNLSATTQHAYGYEMELLYMALLFLASATELTQ